MCLKTPGQVLLLVLDTFLNVIRSKARRLYLFGSTERSKTYYTAPPVPSSASSLPCRDQRAKLAMAIRHNNHSPGPTIKRGYTRHSHGTGYSATLLLLFQVPPPFPDPTRANRKRNPSTHRGTPCAKEHARA